MIYTRNSFYWQKLNFLKFLNKIFLKLKKTLWTFNNKCLKEYIDIIRLQNIIVFQVFNRKCSRKNKGKRSLVKYIISKVTETYPKTPHRMFLLTFSKTLEQPVLKAHLATTSAISAYYLINIFKGNLKIP